MAAKQQLDFLVIGAQKAGTTSLFEYLRRHPQLCLPAAKEVPYFSHDANYGGDWDEYLAKAFPFAPATGKWGTVTPHYMVGGIYDAAGRPDPPLSDERTVPLRIRERLPDVRLIALIRDPIERARSHHAMSVMNGWDTRDFATAVEELLEPGALVRARRIADEKSGYVVWGEYGRILRGYLNVFSREQLLVLYTSELKAEPRAVLSRVYSFVGVDPDFVPENLGTTYRAGAAARRFDWLNLFTLQSAAADNRLARALWRSIPERTRRRIDHRFDHLNYLTDLWNRRGDAHAAPSATATEQALTEHYRSDAQLLRELLGTAPPWADR